MSLLKHRQWKHHPPLLYCVCPSKKRTEGPAVRSHHWSCFSACLFSHGLFGTPIWAAQDRCLWVWRSPLCSLARGWKGKKLQSALRWSKVQGVSQGREKGKVPKREKTGRRTRTAQNQPKWWYRPCSPVAYVQVQVYLGTSTAGTDSSIQTSDSFHKACWG